MDEQRITSRESSRAEAPQITFAKVKDGVWMNRETGVRITRMDNASPRGYMLEIPVYSAGIVGNGVPFLIGNGGWRRVTDRPCSTLKQARDIGARSAARIREEIGRAYDEAADEQEDRTSEPLSARHPICLRAGAGHTSHFRAVSPECREADDDECGADEVDPFDDPERDAQVDQWQARHAETARTNAYWMIDAREADHGEALAENGRREQEARTDRNVGAYAQQYDRWVREHGKAYTPAARMRDTEEQAYAEHHARYGFEPGDLVCMTDPEGLGIDTGTVWTVEQVWDKGTVHAHAELVGHEFPAMRSASKLSRLTRAPRCTSTLAGMTHEFEYDPAEVDECRRDNDGYDEYERCERLRSHPDHLTDRARAAATIHAARDHEGVPAATAEDAHGGSSPAGNAQPSRLAWQVGFTPGSVGAGKSDISGAVVAAVERGELSAMSFQMIEPKYPAGTPEHEAYRAELRVELAKFAAGEAPYEYDRDAINRSES